MTRFVAAGLMITLGLAELIGTPFSQEKWDQISTTWHLWRRDFWFVWEHEEYG